MFDELNLNTFDVEMEWQEMRKWWIVAAKFEGNEALQRGKEVQSS